MAFWIDTVAPGGSGLGGIHIKAHELGSLYAPLFTVVNELTIFDVALQLEVQPPPSVTVNESVYIPVNPAVTVTEEPVVELVMVPAPLIPQL